MENKNLEPLGTIQMAEPERYEQCEWVFQFDEDEPQIFAWTDEESSSDEEPTVTFTIGNTKNAYISFKNTTNGKSLKIFARELTENGKEMRTQRNEMLKNLKTDSENDSENKEA